MTSAIILAAGMGTRLGKYTQDLPKCMLSFLGETLLERQVKTLRSAGVADISIVRGYAANKIALSGVTYFENKEYEATNMVATLMSAREKFESSSDVLVCYADIIYERRLVDQILKSTADVNVLADGSWLDYWKARLDDWESDVESLQHDNQNNLLEIGTSRCPVDQCQARYIGMIKFSSNGIKAFAKAFDENHKDFWETEVPWRKSKSFMKAYMTCMLQELVDRKCNVKVVKVDHGWMEFDTVEDYEKALSWSKEGSLGRFINL